MSTKRVIGLLIETSTARGRGLLRGVMRYAAAQSSWSPHLVDRGLEGFFIGRGRAADVKSWLRRCHFDAIIGRFESHSSIEAAAALGIPTISVLHSEAELPFPVVESNPDSISRLAADHLLERGFHSFAFFGRDGLSWATGRRACFVADIEAAGHRCEWLQRPVLHDGLQAWEKEVTAVSAWVSTLDRPVALMACNDEVARVLLEVCHRLRIAVPDQAAVLGVDDDEVLCDLSRVPLSSIGHDSLRGGYVAALLLDGMLAGRAAPAVTSVEPTGLTTRMSTDVFISRDRHVSMAIRFIRERACQGIAVSDVVAAVPMSRRVLETRFASLVGRTLHDEIQRVRLERVKLLLRTTELSLGDIVTDVGFAYVEHLGRLFKKKFGCTPMRYRDQQMQKLRGSP